MNMKNNPLRQLSESRRRDLTVATVGLALFNDVLLLLMLVPVLPSLVPPSSSSTDGTTKSRDLQLALLFSSKDLFQVLGAPFAGALTLKVGARMSLGISLVGLSASTVTFAEAKGYWQLIAARALQGLTSAALMSGGLTLVAETYKNSPLSEQRGEALARAQSGMGLGAAFGPVLGGLLVERFGRRATFYLAASLVLFNALVAAVSSAVAPSSFVSSSSSSSMSSTSSSSPSRKGKGGNSDGDGKEESPMRQLLSIARNGEVAVVGLGIFTAYAAGGFYDSAFGVHVSESFGAGPAKASLLFSMSPIAYVFALYALGPIVASKTGNGGNSNTTRFKSRFSAFGLALTGLSLPTLTAGTTIGTVLLSAFFLGLGYAFRDAVGHGLLADLVDEHGIGSYAMVYAFADVVDSLGYIIGPLAGMSLCQAIGNNRSGGFLLAGIGCAMLGIPVGRVGEKTSKQRNEKSKIK